MEEDIFKNVPEGIVEDLKIKYEEYKATAEEPVLTFEEFSSKIYEIGLLTKEIEVHEKELEELNSKKEAVEKRLEEIEAELFEIESEKLLEDFSSTYEIIANDSNLTSEEKLDKLKAYYYTVVRNMAKEIRFLNNLNALIKEQDSEGFNDVLLINFNEFVKNHYD